MTAPSTPSNRRPRRPDEILVAAIARFLKIIFVTIPCNAIGRVPHSDALLSMGYLYVFAQCMGILWMGQIGILATLGTNFVDALAANSLMDPIVGSRLILTGYVYYAVLRVTVLCGLGLYTIGWESYGDFPTAFKLLTGMRRKPKDEKKPQGKYGTLERLSAMVKTGLPSVASAIMTPDPSETDSMEPKSATTTATETTRLNRGTREQRRGRSPTVRNFDAASESNSEIWYDKEDKDKPRTRSNSEMGAVSSAWLQLSKDRHKTAYARQVMILTPPLFFSFLSILTFMGQIGPAIDYDENPILMSTFNPRGRINRMARVAILIAFCQWVQQFILIFPQWHRVVRATNFFSTCVVIGLIILTPVSLVRSLQWYFLPVGYGNLSFLGVPHHLMDRLLVTLWITWFAACTCIVMRKENLKAAGCSVEKLMIHSHWRAHIANLKYTFLIPALLHYIRGQFSSNLGPIFARHDLLVLCITYPLIFTMMWAVIFLVFAVARRWKQCVMAFSAALVVAFAVCALTLKLKPVLVILVWCHLIRQLMRAFGVTRKFSVAPDSDEKLKDVYFQQRWVSRLITSAFTTLAIGFTLMCMMFAVVAYLQDAHNIYLQTIRTELAEPGYDGYDRTFTIDHVITKLRFHTNTSERGGYFAQTKPDGVQPWAVPRYAGCYTRFHGKGNDKLSLLDYSLLAEVPYFEPDEIANVMDEFFPSWANPKVTWKLNSISKSPNLRFYAFDLVEPDLTVVAVKGTDPVRARDFLEDCRMWMEPVLLSLLGVVFPSMRVWSRKTSDMVIRGMHGCMELIDLHPKEIYYAELLEFVQSFPRDRQVVLTGHSLGAGLATVVAGLESRPVVAISSPGLYTSMAKHLHLHKDNTNSLEDHAVHHETVTIIGENDFVNVIFDDHAGLVQKIACDESSDIPIACHLLEYTICHLLAHCGDHRGRWEKCSNQISTMMEFGTRDLPPIAREVFGNMDLPWWQWLYSKFFSLRFSWKQFGLAVGLVAAVQIVLDKRVADNAVI